MSTRSLKRAGLDYNRLQQIVETDATILSVVNANAEGTTTNPDIFHWRVEVSPPTGSVYAGATYILLFTLSPENYPFVPPTVRVLTPIFNPMVSVEGEVCEGLLHSNDWKPTRTAPEFVEKVITALFTEYAKYDILNEEAAQLLATDTAGAFQNQVIKVRQGSKV